MNKIRQLGNSFMKASISSGFDRNLLTSKFFPNYDVVKTQFLSKSAIIKIQSD
jgi:hypothetical protein